ncbi:MAG: helix-turn-helix transcriptional regulator [Clostridia bacterium]|nr:helix-turn-helix transcriptional regulator [Clostridia bacterium]
MFQPQLNAAIVGKVIAGFRTNKGMTQEVLSGLCGMGRSHLSAIENGNRKPTLETLYRMSVALDIPMSTIVIAIEDEIKKQL